MKEGTEVITINNKKKNSNIGLLLTLLGAIFAGLATLILSNKKARKNTLKTIEEKDLPKRKHSKKRK